jgi:peptidoglycan/LPS O-acetylase OafA/YrhL
MPRDYEPWIDWLKAVGLTLIVVGHVADTAVAALLPPIYPKQLGVALFLYAAGYGLARERRAAGRVIVGRLFDIYLFGVAIAVIISVAGYAQDGNLRESNYLPFAAGVNVALEAFPANPTTWFIGTYVHLLVAWALLLRRIDLNRRVFMLLLATELMVRGALLEAGAVFTAYMNLFNWIAVFALGIMHGRRVAVPSSGFHVPGSRFRVPGFDRPWAPGPSLALMVTFLAAWRFIVVPAPRGGGFPFMTLAVPFASLAASVAVSALYVVVTFAAAGIARALPAARPVRFIARHTVIVFIGHMPVYFALVPVIAAVTPQYWMRVALHLAACYGALLLVSHAVFSIVPRDRLREWLLAVLSARRSSAKAAAV